MHAHANEQDLTFHEKLHLNFGWLLHWPINWSGTRDNRMSWMSVDDVNNKIRTLLLKPCTKSRDETKWSFSTNSVSIISWFFQHHSSVNNKIRQWSRLNRLHDNRNKAPALRPPYRETSLIAPSAIQRSCAPLQTTTTMTNMRLHEYFSIKVSLVLLRKLTFVLLWFYGSFSFTFAIWEIVK